jgi:hypothetical protein
MAGVGDMGIAHTIGEPGRLERDMQAFRPVRIERSQVEAFENIEQHQRGEALAVGRQFHHVEPAIIRCDRRRRFAAMAREIIPHQP